MVRDARSLEICREAGANCSLVPDVVMHLPAWLNGDKTKTIRSGRYAAVCLRSSSNAFGQFKLDEKGLCNLAGALDSLAIEKNLQIIFLPFQVTLDHLENDNVIHAEVAKRMRKESRVVIQEWTGDLAEVEGIISGAECVIAMRLHAAILARACNRPCAIMPYDYKLNEAAQIFRIRTLITPEILSNLEKLAKLVLSLPNEEGNFQPELTWESVSFCRPSA